MRASFVFLFIICLLFIRCRNNQSHKNLSGVYVNKSQSEYSIAFDTLIISRKSEYQYQVERKTGFQKIRKGTTLSKQFKSTKWTAQWNQDKMILSETDLGRQIGLDQNSNSVNLKNTKYLKIK